MKDTTQRQPPGKFCSMRALDFFRAVIIEEHFVLKFLILVFHLYFLIFLGGGRFLL